MGEHGNEALSTVSNEALSTVSNEAEALSTVSNDSSTHTHQAQRCVN